MKIITTILCGLLITSICYSQDSNRRRLKRGTTVTHNHADTVKVKLPEEKKTCCCEDPKSPCLELLEKNNTAEIVIPKDITIDFKTKQMALPKNYRQLKKGQVLRVKILNYNPYLYKVLIDSKDSTIISPSDGKLLSWFLDPSNLSGIVANLISNIGTAPIPIAAAIDTTAFFNFNVHANIRKDLMTEAYGINEPESKKPIDTFAVSLNTLQSHSEFMRQRQKRISSLINEIEKKQYEILRKFSIQRQIYPDCEKFKLVTSETSINEIEESMSTFRQSLSAELNGVIEDLDKFYIATAPYRGFINRTAGLKINDSLINQFYKDAKSELSKADSIISFKKIADIIAQLEILAQNSSCLVSLPIFITEDAKSLSIEFKPRYDSLTLPGYKTSFILPTVQQKVWGVSSGVYLSFMHSDGYNNKSFTRTNSAGGVDTLYNLVKDNPGAGQFGINALAYTGWKIKPNNDNPNYFGLCFGAGMSVENKVKPRILLGGSFISGEKNRIVVSLGIIGGNTSKLSNAFNTTNNYEQPAEKFLKDVFKINGFFSINYSFYSK